MTAATESTIPGARRLDVTRLFFIGVFVYFALQVLLRVLASYDLGYDEAEQVVMGQTFQFAYGPQAPLYTWLYMAVRPLTGGGALTLGLIKFGLLAGTALAVWRLAGRLGAGPVVAVAAAMSLAFLPQIVWESQRTLAHTVLAFACVAAATAAFAEMATTRRLRDYLLFGAALAACVLSKPNAIIFPVALLIAGATVAGVRPALKDWRLAAGLALTTVLVLPTVLGMAANRNEAMARAYELYLGEGGLLTSGYAAFVGIAGVVALPFVLLCAARFLPAGKDAPAEAVEPSPLLRAVVRALVLAGACVLIATLITQAGAVKDRWVAPVLFLGAPAAVVWMAPKLTARRRAALMGMAGFLIVGCTAGILAYPYLGDLWERPPYRNAPFEAVVVIPEEGLLISDDHWMAGNLHRRHPGLIPVTVEYPFALPEEPYEGSIVMVWEAVYGPRPRAPLAALAEQVTGEPLPEELRRYCLFEPYPHGGAELQMCVVRLR